MTTLRTDNHEYQEHSENISYRPKGKACYKPAPIKCRDGIGELEQMRDLHRANACHIPHCLPTRKCMSKVGLTDEYGNMVPTHLQGMNATINGTMGQRIGYIFQERTIVDENRMAEALRANNPLGTNVVIRIAEENQKLYGKTTDWNGNASGYPCMTCKPRPVTCKRQKCKKADPFFHITGLGSDVAEARSDAREAYHGREFMSAVGATQSFQQPQGEGLAQISAQLRQPVQMSRRNQPQEETPQEDESDSKSSGEMSKKLRGY